MRVLVVEDEKIINNNITEFFRLEEFIVDQAYDYSDAIEKASCQTYDAFILDINLPSGNGFDLLKAFKEKCINTPAIFLTARDSLEDMKNAYKIGADDYLIKPFDLSILVLKVRNLINRTTKIEPISYIGKYRFNLEKRSLFKENNEISLTAKELIIIEYLLSRSNCFVTTEEIMEHTNADENNLFSQAVKIHIHNIRKKAPNLIDSERGKGYCIKTDEN